MKQIMNTRLIYACILGFVGFVTSFGAHIVAVNLPSYAATVGVGLAMIGLLIAAYDFAEVIAKPLFGFLADKAGMKKTMLAGILVFTLASFSFLVIDPHWLLVVRFVQGIGAAALSAVSLALVGVYYQAHRGRAYGIYNAIKGAGYVISPILGGVIIARSNFSSIFLAAGAIGVVSFLLSLVLPDTKEKASLEDDDDFSLQSFLAVFKAKELLPWFSVTIVNMFFVGILFGFLPVRIHALGYSPVQSGLLLSVVSFSYLLIQPVAGYLADKVNPALTIRIGLFLAAISVILVPFVTTIPLVVVSILAGVGVGIVWTNTDALISSLAKEGKMGATMGAAGSFKEVGDMAGPLVIGILSQTFGLTVGFVTCGILGLFALLLVRK
jgi:MFS family permease